MPLTDSFSCVALPHKKEYNFVRGRTDLHFFHYAQYMDFLHDVLDNGNAWKYHSVRDESNQKSFLRLHLLLHTQHFLTLQSCSNMHAHLEVNLAEMVDRLFVSSDQT